MRSSLLLKLALLACVAVPACSAQDAASAREFLQSVYARYLRNGPGVEIGGAHASQYLHSSLIALIREDARVVEGVGVLDGDPLCGCQDWDGIFDLNIDVHEPRAGRAAAHVSFALFERAKPEDMRSLVITLAQEKGAWRVWNVVDRSDAKAVFDLRSELLKEVREYAKRGTKNPTSQKRDVGHP